MVGIELVADRTSKRPFPWQERRGARVCNRAMEKGVFIRPLGDVVVLMPPLAISEKEIDRLTTVVAECLGEVLG
jgi:adenosylmethionine-8-amino-7-oxononanoate aminotransferase